MDTEVLVEPSAVWISCFSPLLETPDDLNTSEETGCKVHDRRTTEKILERQMQKEDTRCSAPWSEGHLPWRAGRRPAEGRGDVSTAQARLSETGGRTPTQPGTERQDQDVMSRLLSGAGASFNPERRPAARSREDPRARDIPIGLQLHASKPLAVGHARVQQVHNNPGQVKTRVLGAAFWSRRPEG